MILSSTTELDLPTIELVSDLPGFPGLRRFVLVQLDENGLLFDFQSLDQPEVRFVVVPSIVFFSDYAPEIDAVTASGLGIESSEQAWLLLIVTVGADLRDSTANLRAPLVVNVTTREATQVVLADERLSLREPLRSS
jgi:flagellar assembly factor FliW